MIKQGSFFGTICGKNQIWITILLTLLPLLSAVIMCMGQGLSIREVYLPNSLWNDELYYYKGVESILTYGAPKGYFGYNESHANYLNLGAWSPVLYIFFCLYGIIFGWTYFSPIFCNILIMSISLFIVAVLLKPNLKQASALASFLLLFMPINRYMLSGTPESSVICLLIIYFAVCMKMIREDKFEIILMAWLYVISATLTLMRPYYILLTIIPCYYSYKNNRYKKICIGRIGIFYFALCFSYIWINKNLCAPYFGEIINTSWLKLLIADPWKGFFNIGHVIVSAFYKFSQQASEGIITGSVAGGWSFLYFVITAWLIWSCCQKTEGGGKYRFLWLFASFSFAILLLAIFLLYDVYVGSRHLMGFIILGLLAMAFCESLNKNIMMMSLLFWLFIAKGTDSYTLTLPALSEESSATLEEGKNYLQNVLIIDEDSSPWENTVVWVSEDMKWQELYSLPAGFGINFCFRDYVFANYGQLKSKYIMVDTGTASDQFCLNNGAELIAEYGQWHIWKIH